jgi:hypothetical protein
VLTYSDEQFQYTLNVDTVPVGDIRAEQVYVKSIEVRRLIDSQYVQTLFPLDNFVGFHFPPSQWFIIEDVNFDGHNDLRLLQFVPAAPNLIYYYWVYNTSKGMFEKSTVLENVTNPSFDKASKMIHSEWRDGCCRRGNDEYKYFEGTLILTGQTEVTIDPVTEVQTLTKRKLINGVLTDYEFWIE